MMRVPSHFRSVCQLAFLALWLIAEAAGAQSPAAPPTPVADTPVVHIKSLLGEGLHPKLKWSSFGGYQAFLEQLYGQNAWLPLWVKSGQVTPQAQALVDSLAEADDQGLESADYDANLLKDWLAGAAANPREIASFDVALSLSAMRYLSHLYLGRVNPRTVNFGFNIERKRVDLPNLIQKISQSGRPLDLIHAMEPRLPLYLALKAVLPRYRKLAKDVKTPHFAFPAKFGPGGQDKGVPALRRFLHELGDLEEVKPGMADSTLYDADLAAAVKSFQQRHGLGGDGVIGKGTLAHLNFPLTARLEQIQLGMERLRWLPNEIPGTYLMVNIPSFQLFGFRDGAGFGRHDIQMNVIVGEAANGRNTPAFHADMTYVNFRPYWNVPYKITAKELLPIIQRNPGYLAHNNMEIVAGFGPNAPAYEPSGANIQMLATGALKLRQKPGPKNALGLVKFAFPNHNNVYLHSTPSKGLFQRARRDFSHGCIRVQDPVGLAEWVLKDRGEWNRARIESAMSSGSQKTVTLKQAIPVFLFYSTVLADERGRVGFFEDLYGHDVTLQALLSKGFPYQARL
jgi:murein L,D-transpeptidase YcbB/YkuD